MSIVANENTSLGSCQNFGRLLECSTADYLMFCDQDDVWISQKIELMLHALQETERQFGKQTPVLVHSDLKVTTANLQIISDSFWKYQFILPEIGCKFSRLLMQNAVTGNTVIMNRSAKEHTIPIPEEAIMHDWWLALVVSAFGQIRHLPFPTVLYRQHEGNAVSAKKWGYEFIIGNISRGHLFHELRKRMVRRESQARCFLNRYKLQLNSEQCNAAIAMANLSKLSPIARRRAIWRYQLLMMGFLRNAVLFLTV